MNLLIASTKGGVGKSMLTTNLACWLATKNADVIILDADQQATSKKWVDRRAAHADGLPPVHVAQASGDISRTSRELSARFQHVITDVTGNLSREFISGLRAADVVLLPTKPSTSDLETMAMVSDLVAAARLLNPTLKAYTLVNMASSNPRVTEAADAREFLAQFTEFEPVPGVIGVIPDRVIYHTASLTGMGVVECRNKDAKGDIELLGQFIYEIQGK